jgi:hypothetical protein
MSTEAVVFNFTRKAGGDLSAAQYKFVKQANTGRVSVCTVGGENAFGVLQNDPAAIDREAQVAILGVTKVMAGGTVAIGDLIETDASGRAVTASSGVILGEAVTGGSVGSIISMLLRPRASTGYVFSSNATDIQVATVTIPYTAVRTLFTTPVELVPAPGAGYANVLQEAVVFLDYGSAGYDAVGGSDELTIKYTNGSGAVCATVEGTGFLNATSDQVRVIKGAAAADVTPVANAALVAHITTGEIYTAAGDSPLKFKVYYRVVPTAF